MIAGFMKVRNEILREGNIYRALANLEAVCDCGVLCDDGSLDGTREILEDFAKKNPSWVLVTIDPDKSDFAQEMRVKGTMLEALHALHKMGTPIDWVWWLDGDEAVDRAREFREWVNALPVDEVQGYRFHYTQLWRGTTWARTDDGFDDGVFLKLWRYHPGLYFNTAPGLHNPQFPATINYQACPVAPFEVLHFGNVGKNLTWKGIQYSGGRGGVDRHLAFGHTPAESMATGVGFDEAKWSCPSPTYRKVDLYVAGADPEPKPFTLDDIRTIRSLGDMRGLEGWFTVVVPAYNRGATLPRALESLLAQTYTKWIAVVLDDGSTDDTPQVMRSWQDRDPRIFYARYMTNRGGVAMNEIGMSLACEWTEWWSRLGSDDWWGPGKLEADAAALKDHAAVFGPFTVWKNGKPDHVCAGQWQDGPPSDLLKAGRFAASWANVAVRTDVLRRVKARWGSFCDPSLRNMEDFLVNARIAHTTEWAWRPGHPADAFWNCLEGVGAPADASASANAAITARDDALTRALIARIQP